MRLADRRAESNSNTLSHITIARLHACLLLFLDSADRARALVPRARRRLLRHGSRGTRFLRAASGDGCAVMLRLPIPTSSIFRHPLHSNLRRRNPQRASGPSATRSIAATRMPPPLISPFSLTTRHHQIDIAADSEARAPACRTTPLNCFYKRAPGSGNAGRCDAVCL